MKKPKNNTDEIQFKPKKKKRKKLPYWTLWIVFGITFLGSLSTFFVITLTYYSLQEIKTQRLKSDEPIVLVESEKLNLYSFLYDSIGKNGSTMVSYYSYVDEIDTNNIIGGINKTWWSLNPNNFYLYPKNIGNGVALDVQFNFEFDTIFFLQFVNKYKNYSFNNLDTIINFNGNIILINNLDTAYLSGLTHNTSVPFILNYDKERNPNKIRIPDTYFQLFSLFEFTILGIGICDRTDTLFSDYIRYPPPNLILNISYKDINNKTYDKDKYELVFRKGGIMKSDYNNAHLDYSGMMNVDKMN